MAEGVRFELTVLLRRHRISSAAHSTALASLRYLTGQALGAREGTTLFESPGIRGASALFLPGACRATTLAPLQILNFYGERIEIGFIIVVVLIFRFFQETDHFVSGRREQYFHPALEYIV